MQHTRPSYPPARRDDLVEAYHGTPVADPYRWLEDDHSAETAAFIAAQNTLTRTFLDAVPERAAIQARITALWDYPRLSLPFRRGTRYFVSRNTGLQNQSLLYVREGRDGAERLLIDPNGFSADGTTAMTGTFIDHDGQIMAYALAQHGSDWNELHVRDISSGEDYPDLIRWIRFSNVAWKRDRSGFFYSRYPEPGTVPPEQQTYHQRVYWHQLGSPQSADQLVYARPDAPELGFSPFFSYDGAYLLLYVWHGTDPENRLYYRPAADDGDFVRLLDAADASYTFIENDGPVFYVKTDLDAPRGRIIAIDIRQPERSSWREILPQAEDTLAFARVVNQQLIVGYIHDAQHKLLLYELDGRFVREIALPTIGTISGLSGRREDPELLIGFQSFLYPPTSLRYDFAAAQLSILEQPELDFDPQLYTTRQVFCSSADGTRVPIFLVHRKDLQLDRNNPTLLYGYGGFNISQLPAFSLSRLLWIEQGGVYAQANLRGGEEYGETWHRAGMLDQKQNVFDDFIAAAEWLIQAGYTRPAKLAIEGRSNGGLLVGACMVQRPELYGAVICGVPVLDMLRYHRFTVGRYWVGEYGNAETDPEHFRFLYAYSPLHNLKPGTAYPPTLILTADTDDRVVPAHARKFAAALQYADGGTAPLLLRVEMKAGHGLGKPTAKLIEELSDVLAFLFRVLEQPYRKPAQPG